MTCEELLKLRTAALSRVVAQKEALERELAELKKELGR